MVYFNKAIYRNNFALIKNISLDLTYAIVSRFHSTNFPRDIIVILFHWRGNFSARVFKLWIRIIPLTKICIKLAAMDRTVPFSSNSIALLIIVIIYLLSRRASIIWIQIDKNADNICLRYFINNEKNIIEIMFFRQIFLAN